MTRNRMGIASLGVLIVLFVACGSGGASKGGPDSGVLGGGGATGSLAVTYEGNGNTGGIAPFDAQTYQPGATVAVLGNTGNMVKTGYTFAGWNTLADGSGTTYLPAQTLQLGTVGVVLYAQWTAIVVVGYAYVANQYDGSVSQYMIAEGGTLVPMTPPTLVAGDTPEAITVDPSGKYVYVANVRPTPAGKISQYVIGATGALSPMATPSASAGTYPVSIVVDPSGKYAYVANNQSGDVSEFALGADGALAPIGTVKSEQGYPNAPASVVVDPSGKYVYVANADGKSVSQYTIGADGSLSPMTPTSVPTNGKNGNAYHMTVHPSGAYLYVAGYFDNVVFQYAIGANGALSPLTPASVATDTYPGAIAVDPSGKFAYVVNANAAAAISLYTVGADGVLTPMSPATLAATTYFANVAIDSSGKYLYATSGYPGSTVLQYTIGATGTLTPMAQPSVPSGSGPNAIVIVKK
jgi:6-phosphogluconolactonase